MSTPAISVVMPVYNAAAYLAAAVESILEQAHGDFELIVVDDGSTDESAAILERYAEKDGRMVVVSRANTGLVGALNDGLARVRGPLIARMDGDDISLPERLAEQLAFMNGHRECVAVGTWMTVVDPYNEPLREYQPVTEHDAIDEALLAGHGGMIAHPTVMMRTKAVRAVGGYRAAFEFAEDHDLFLRLAEMGRLANLARPLYRYRQHQNNFCFTWQREQADRLQAVVAEARRRRGLPAAAGAGPGKITDTLTQADRVRSWALHAIARGNGPSARTHARALLRHAPTRVDSWRVFYWACRA